MGKKHIGTSVPKDIEIKHYVFDYLGTSDGYEVGWLHEEGQKHIYDPDSELFYDKYGMYDVAKELILEGHDFTNYWLDEDDIDEIVEERDRCKECEGEGSIISPTYDDPYNEVPCPECSCEHDI
mgnify:CR=1 FL=1|tara:strand:- start:59 stop:430 length:372 start_codon:yes stop_codon:yes gene_type:complete